MLIIIVKDKRTPAGSAYHVDPFGQNQSVDSDVILFDLIRFTHKSKAFCWKHIQTIKLVLTVRSRTSCHSKPTRGCPRKTNDQSNEKELVKMIRNIEFIEKRSVEDYGSQWCYHLASITLQSFI